MSFLRGLFYTSYAYVANYVENENTVGNSGRLCGPLYISKFCAVYAGKNNLEIKFVPKTYISKKLLVINVVPLSLDQ